MSYFWEVKQQKNVLVTRPAHLQWPRLAQPDCTLRKRLWRCWQSRPLRWEGGRSPLDHFSSGSPKANRQDPAESLPQLSDTSIQLRGVVGRNMSSSSESARFTFTLKMWCGIYCSIRNYFDLEFYWTLHTVAQPYQDFWWVMGQPMVRGDSGGY